MNLKKQKPSDRVVIAQQVNRTGMGPSEDKAGKGDRLFNSPEFQNALNGISTQFQDKIHGRVGKSDRQNDPNSPANKYVAENWLNRSKDKISTIKPKMKPRVK